MSSSLIRYFRDCYEADNRRGTIWNIFKSGIEHRYFFGPGEELLNGLLPHAPVDVAVGKQARETARIYRKEKDLLYCSLFVVGMLEEEAKQQPICAPLLMHPAQFVSHPPHVFVAPDLQDRRINHRVLEQVHRRPEEGSLTERLAGSLSHKYLSLDQVMDLAALLEAAVHNLDASALYDYPVLYTERQLRKVFQAMQNGAAGTFLVVPASCIALVRKSVQTRGVLNELAVLAEEARLSTPIQVLFEEVPQAIHASKKIDLGRVPAVLSAAQDKVLRQAAVSPLTLVIGPPGTGKSYTIAALALEHLSRGQTVLIASKMNHAVDVVGTKMEQKLGGETSVVRGGRKQYLRQLKRYLKELLSGMHTAEPVSRKELHGVKARVKQLDRTIAALEIQILRQNQREIAWGRVLAREDEGIILSMRSRWVRWKARRSVPLWRLVDRLEYLLQTRTSAISTLLRLRNRFRLQHLLQKHRTALNTFSKAIRSRTGSRQDNLFGTLDFEVLLQAFPVWLVNLSDVHKVLPLERELFDLAIIDEATQCDIASCLPLLHRAKRAVITGDPNQLRHVSFLSRDRQQAFLDKHRLSPEDAESYDYREKSILDLVDDRMTTQTHVTFLNEHFRSVPSIIAFSNEQFYGGALHVMTERPGREGRHPVVLLQGKGSRAPEGHNPDEAQRLLDDLGRLVEKEKRLSPHLAHSIGVLSPFRSQVDYLAEQITQVLPVDAFDKHDLLVGTAHTFQGEERDVMFISMVVDPEAHAATLRFLNRPDVFNVSITRARIAQRLYTSFDPSDLDQESLLFAYLHAIGRSEVRGRVGDQPSDEEAEAVKRALEARGMRTWSAYPIAGLTMDVVAAAGRRSCGIDLIGFPGAFEQAFPLERYKMFYRAGLKLIPLPYTRWLTDRGQCLNAIEKTIRP
ncbi:MAG: DEAD/DEAH box helicase [Rhodothermales bacterium]